MKESKTLKTTINVFDCPNCGEEEGEYAGVKCISCGHKFSQEEIENKSNWRREEVKAIKCDDCGMVVPCTTPYESKFGLLCPNESCENGILSIKYRGKWRVPESFFTFRNHYGIIQATTKREKIIAKILNYIAKKEKSQFLSVPRQNVFVKILWMEEEARGYYSFSPNWAEKEIPCLTQLFVLPNYRRKGYGRFMIEDFLKSFEDKIAFESPLTKEAIELFKDIDLVKLQEKKLVSKDKRIVFVNSGI